MHILIHRSQLNLFLRGNIMMQLQLLRQYLTDCASCSGCFFIFLHFEVTADVKKKKEKMRRTTFIFLVYLLVIS